MPAWVVRTMDQALCREVSKELLVSPLQARLLLSRGMQSVEDAVRFMNPSFDKLHDPFLFNEMEKAASLLHNAVTSGRKILIHGDYDADGICGTALLYQGLSGLGADVEYFIPDRARDGYGLAMRVLERGVEIGLSTVVSVDCGSSDHREIEFLSGHGVDVIVTDHHETPERIPEAAAFLNPKLPGESYPFKELAGAGVAFKLLQGLEKIMGVNLSLESLIDLAALGTLGDYTALQDENRILAYLGLERIARWDRPGLSALRNESGLPREGFSARQVCFTLVPRLNSPGRIGSARKVVELLLTDDAGFAGEIAKEIEEKNRLRKAHDNRVTEEACYLADIILKRSDPSALVFSSSSWHEGVVGISAARLAERYNLPVALIAVKEGVGKGSVRSAGTVNIKDVLERCSSYLKVYGGHKEAGGFSITEENIPEFQSAFEEAVDELGTPAGENCSLYADSEIILEDCGLDLITFINRLAPFGPGNHEPVFLLKSVKALAGSRIVGDAHLKMAARDSAGTVHDMIGFSLGRAWSPGAIDGTDLDMLVHLRRNKYLGKVRSQLQVTAIRLAGEHD